MAYDLALGQTARDWSRGEDSASGNWLTEKSASKAWDKIKSLPWSKILAGLAVVTGVIILASPKITKKIQKGDHRSWQRYQ